MKDLFIAGQRITLDPAQLLKSGGEGSVFALDAKAALKLYHQPSPQRTAKLAAMIATFGHNLPGNVLVPQQAVQDYSGAIVGFLMPRLPRMAQPLKKLAQISSSASQPMGVRALTYLFQQIHETLTCLHGQGIVVGDLNDDNVYFTAKPGSGAYWLDVDSYQFASYPCPVALASFVDPHLYHIKDFSQRPYFSPHTDWYAFAVLFFKSLLRVHPYGGSHAQSKSLQARAIAGITILDPAVIRPKSSRPIEILSDEMLDHFKSVFGRGERPRFTRDMLMRYERGLITCQQCDLVFPAERGSCPTCRRHTVTARPASLSAGLSARQLLATDGEIVYVAVQATGRMILIIQRNQDYTLAQAGVGGMLAENHLFQGSDAYRFGYFGHNLVVNLENSRQLLILDCSGPAPKQVTLQETGTFLDKAIFATTPEALYRLAGGYIMRGIVRGGLYIEDVVATARPQQTEIWAGATADIVMSSTQHFTQSHCSLFSGAGHQYPITVPGRKQAESRMAMTAIPGKHHSALLMQTKWQGQRYCRIALYDRAGQVVYCDERPADSSPYNRISGKVLADTTLYHPVDGGIVRQTMHASTVLADSQDQISAADTLHLHPAGLLIQQNQRLLLLDWSQVKHS